MEIKEMNIFQRMGCITEKLNRVAKNLQVGVGQSSYKAVGEADVLAAVKPVETEFGVYSYPIKREVIYSNEFTTTTEYKGETKEKLTLFMRIKTVYRFVNIDKPEEYIEVETFGDGVDTQDKAPGKAMTYADKYALLKAYKIETGDDPDQNASQQMNKITPKKQNDIPTEEIVGGAYVLNGGKYNGKTIQEVYDIDKPYVEWCAENSKSYTIREQFKKCLRDNGEIPTFEI